MILIDTHNPLYIVIKTWIYDQFRQSSKGILMTMILQEHDIIWNIYGITLPDELLTYITLISTYEQRF